MFQYATKYKVIVDTDLITREEADKLMAENIEDLKDNWDELSSPQMCIWVGCDKNTDYHTMAVDIDFRDCILEDGHFYRVKKEKII